MRPIVTLLTDFGTADGYVGQMKGVILTQAPDVALVDVSHEIDAHDVDAARLTVARYWRRFPVRTIHLVVVDPGVGTERRALAVRSEDRFLAGPDNGVLSPALLLPGAEVVALPIPRQASPTFHGRDVFAPAAAALATGVALSALGAAVADPVILRTPEPERNGDGTLRGQIIAIDRFGNAITNLATAARRDAAVQVGSRRIPVVRTYADVSPGSPCAVVGSTGLLEVSVREASAAKVLALRRGDAVTLL